jgi:NnrS protein/uncharacterized protein DUF1858
VAGLRLTDSVRSILRERPGARAVLDRYGLMGCGGAEGPDETLEFFARAHHVPLDALMRDLESANAPARSGEPARAAGTAAGAPSAEVYRVFLFTSLALTLTFGATLGMINLARLTWTLGALPPASVWAHAYVQVFGFVGLFVMGVACHVLPRFAATELRSRRTAFAAFGAQVAGVSLTTMGFLLAEAPMAPFWIAGTTLTTLAALIFTATIVRTLASGRPSPEPFAPWVIAGSIWLVAASALTLVAAVTGDVAWHQIVWATALLGFAASWIFGVGRRVFPVFLGWRPAYPRLERPVFVLFQASVASWAIGAWPAESLALTVFRIAGLAGLFIAVAGVSAIAGVWRTPEAAGPGGLGSTVACRRQITAAWLWLAAGLLASIGRSPLVVDFARHALAFGFIAQTIMAVAQRVLPIFSGHQLWSPRGRTAAAVLLNAAVVVRGLEVVVAAGVAPAAWPFIALSGPPAVAAVVIFALNVVFTVVGPARSAARTDAVAQGGPRRAVDPADMLVSDILDIPGALDVLVAAGFAPLRQPALRATLARTVTLGQACRMTHVDIEPLAAWIRAARPRPPIIPLTRVS